MGTPTASRRPGSLWTRGVVASAAAGLLLAGCGGGTVEVPSPDLAPDERAACDEFLAALPDELAGLEEAQVDPEDAPARAWGDGLAVVCGVGEPDQLEPTSECTEMVGIGWFLPPEEYDDESVELTATALGYRPRVALVVPPEHRGQDSFAAFEDLADPVAEHLELVQPCL